MDPVPMTFLLMASSTRNVRQTQIQQRELNSKKKRIHYCLATSFFRIPCFLLSGYFGGISGQCSLFRITTNRIIIYRCKMQQMALGMALTAIFGPGVSAVLLKRRQTGGLNNKLLVIVLFLLGRFRADESMQCTVLRICLRFLIDLFPQSEPNQMKNL